MSPMFDLLKNAREEAVADQDFDGAMAIRELEETLKKRQTIVCPRCNGTGKVRVANLPVPDVSFL